MTEPGVLPVQEQRQASTPHSPRVPSGVAEAPISSLRIDEEMVGLHHQVEALLPDISCRAVQFIGSREGEGTSSIAREFALLCATRFARRVLLLVLDRPDADDKSLDLAAGDGAPVRAGATTLYVGRLPRALTAADGPHAGGSAAVWARLRTSYDLIVVDSPPAAGFPEGLTVAGQVDGVILVVEAEATRWPVAARAKESIVRSGGRVLGVVFNKRRHHIPAFIYNWL